jgi:hypothetical protein
MHLFDRRPGRRLRGWRVAALAVACLWLRVPAAAQDPPARLGGRVSVGGEISATIAPEDEGYFNYSDYGVSRRRSCDPTGVTRSAGAARR